MSLARQDETLTPKFAVPALHLITFLRDRCDVEIAARLRTVLPDSPLDNYYPQGIRLPNASTGRFR